MPTPRRFVQTEAQTTINRQNKKASFISTKSKVTYQEEREETVTAEVTQAIIAVESMVSGGGLRCFAKK